MTKDRRVNKELHGRIPAQICHAWWHFFRPSLLAGLGLEKHLSIGFWSLASLLVYSCRPRMGFTIEQTMVKPFFKYSPSQLSPFSYKRKYIIVCRMIESFKGASSEVKNMIDIQFQQSATQDKTSISFIMLFALLFYIRVIVAFTTFKWRVVHALN